MHGAAGCGVAGYCCDGTQGFFRDGGDATDVAGLLSASGGCGQSVGGDSGYWIMGRPKKRRPLAAAVAHARRRDASDSACGIEASDHQSVAPGGEDGGNGSAELGQGSATVGTRGDAAIEWIETYCRVPEGQLIGEPVRLREWQREFIRRIYDNPMGTRRAICSFGRKNGKTALAAFLLLLHLCGVEAKANSQLYSAAQSRDQAGLLFSLAAKMVRLNPDLHNVLVIRDTAKQLFCPELGTLYRALSAEASTAYGLSPVFIVHDELGQVRGERSPLYEALETATGAQSNPLSIVISTQAPSASDLFSVLIDDALAGHDPRVVASIWSADEDDDPFAEATIRKANPAFGDFLNAEEVLAMAEDARRMPSREAEYRNLVLNQRVEAQAPFVSRMTWQACKGMLQDIERVPVYGGLDLSEVSDLTAMVLIGKVKDKWHIHPEFWLPADGLREKSRLDRVPYDLWSQQGHLHAVEGKSIDYEFVAYRLKQVFEQYDVAKIAFDRWNFKHLKPCLLRAGLTEEIITERFVEFGQGFQSMSPALRELGVLLLSGKIVHGDNPVMNMCAVSAVTKVDPAGNKKLDKAKSTSRIDGMIALAMAVAVASVGGEAAAEPEYQMLFI